MSKKGKGFGSLLAKFKQITRKKDFDHETGECLDEYGDGDVPPVGLPSLPESRANYSNHSNIPHLQKMRPELKHVQSNDSKLNLLNKTAKKFSAGKPYKDTSHSEIEHDAWMTINENKCDQKWMRAQAAHKCGTYDCPCTKRLKYVMAHCSQYMEDHHPQQNNPSYSLYSAQISTFMSSLNGYSTDQLTYDFKHLQRFHRIEKDAQNNVYNEIKCLLEYMTAYNNKKREKNRVQQQSSHRTHTAEPDKHKHSKEKDPNEVLRKVAELMSQLSSVKEFNQKYMRIAQINKGANGIIYAVKNWRTRKHYAMKEVSFKNLNINILYEILRNWIMVQKLNLVGKNTQIYIDSRKQTLIIVLHLFKGSMCDYLKETVMAKNRCLKEIELKAVLKNGVLATLAKLHSTGYIHGDIKPENIVYEYVKNKNNKLAINTAVIDYDLCTKYKNDAGADSSVHDDDDVREQNNDETENNDARAAESEFEMDEHGNDNGNDTVYAEWRGTLGYSAPEWSPYRGIKSNISPKVDVFSLGLTMLILLRGEQPFLCPTAVKKRLLRENPGLNIKKFVYEAMMHKGEFMVSCCLKQLLQSKKVTNDLHNLLQFMLEFDADKRANIEQIENHRWFSN